MKKLTEEQLEKNRRINKKLLPIIIAIFTFLLRIKPYVKENVFNFMFKKYSLN